jgi:hypothetical protein
MIAKFFENIKDNSFFPPIISDTFWFRVQIEIAKVFECVFIYIRVIFIYIFCVCVRMNLLFSVLSKTLYGGRVIKKLINVS